MAAKNLMIDCKNAHPEINNRLTPWIIITQLDTNHCIHYIQFLARIIQSKKYIIAISDLKYYTYTCLPILGLFLAYFMYRDTLKRGVQKIKKNTFAESSKGGQT
jgi:hypothetical protein